MLVWNWYIYHYTRRTLIRLRSSSLSLRAFSNVTRATLKMILAKDLIPSSNGVSKLLVRKKTVHEVIFNMLTWRLNFWKVKYMLWCTEKNNLPWPPPPLPVPVPPLSSECLGSRSNPFLCDCVHWWHLTSNLHFQYRSTWFDPYTRYPLRSQSAGSTDRAWDKAGRHDNMVRMPLQCQRFSLRRWREAEAGSTWVSVLNWSGDSNEQNLARKCSRI